MRDMVSGDSATMSIGQYRAESLPIRGYATFQNLNGRAAPLGASTEGMRFLGCEVCILRLPLYDVGKSVWGPYSSISRRAPYYKADVGKSL